MSSKVQMAGPSGSNQQNPGDGTGMSQPMEPGKIPSPAYIKKMWTQGIARRRMIDREAWQNIAFIGGHHYAVWDGNTHRFYAPDPRQDRQLRLQVNLVKDMWRGEVANMVAGKPIPRVFPVTAEESDKQIAMVGQRVLDHEMHRTNFPLKRLEVAGWVSAAGLSYIHPWCNPDSGDQGDICLDVIPHFEVVVDPACRFSAQEGQYIIHGRVLTQEEAYERFGEKFVPEADTQPFAWNTLFQGGQFNNSYNNKRGILVIRMWHKPSRKYPDGFVATAINGKMVEQITPYPYTHGLLPFIDFHHIRLPGRYEGQAMLTDLIPLQRDYNQSRSRMAELRKLFVGARWIAPTGSMHADRMTGLPNEVVEYDVTGPYKPEPLQIPQVPNFIFATADQALKEMQDLAGIHDQTKAPSGAAVLALQEQDHAKLATTLLQQEKGVELMGMQVLGLVRQFWTEPRLVRTWDEELDVTGVKYFEGADLQGQFAVHVVPGSSLPRSQSATSNNLMQLWERKVITDPAAILKNMDLPNSDQLVDVLSIDTRQAKREHDRIFAADPNAPVIAEFWHNHEAHIASHNAFRKGETFEKWPPPLQGELADHVTQHYELYMQQRSATIQLVTDEYVSAEAQQTAAYIQAQQASGMEEVIAPTARQTIDAPKPLDSPNLQPVTPVQQVDIPPAPGVH